MYEIVSDVNSRQDMIEERLSCLEEKLNNIQLSLELLPDMLSRSVESLTTRTFCDDGKWIANLRCKNLSHSEWFQIIPFEYIGREFGNVADEY